jgi:F-box-like
MNLVDDIFQVIFSFVKERKNYLSVMLVCKKWNKFAYKYLDVSIDDQYAIGWAAENGHLQVVKRLLQDSRVGKVIPTG